MTDRVIPFTVNDSDPVRHAFEPLAVSNFAEFEKRFAHAMEHQNLAPQEKAMLYFLRAGYKVHACDPSMLQDLKRCEALMQAPIRIERNSSLYLGDDPIILRYICLNTSSLANFRAAVDKAAPIFANVTGDEDIKMLGELLKAEIYYMWGKIDKAISIAAPIYAMAKQNGESASAFYSGFVLLRCLILTGESAWFHLIYSELTERARLCPRFEGLQKRISGFVEATTGFLGAVPRYTLLPNGVEIANIDARVTCRSSLKNSKLYTQYFTPALEGEGGYFAINIVSTHIFHAMMYFKHLEEDAAMESLKKAFIITESNRIVMPYVEYGRQIVPLLRAAMKRGVISRLTLNKLTALCIKAEDGLTRIREQNEKHSTVGLPDGLLTKAELRVFRNICNQKSLDDISQELHIKKGTVSELARRVYRKLHVNGRKEAIAKAKERGYFD